MSGIAHEKYMSIAIEEAETAYKEGEVPVGAVIIFNDTIIARAHNMTVSSKLATAHAEILAINAASKVMDDWRLNNTILYCTLEPCFMCAGAIIQARIAEVVFGAPEPKFGAIVSNAKTFDIRVLNHKPAYKYGIKQDEIAGLMRSFFKQARLL
jgi:tRNA(adenine34) deaminase